MANYRLRVGFSVGYSLSANAGSYSLTGMAAVLTYAGSSSNITSSVVASRTGGAGVTGVAPLYVHFDATGTTSSDGNITNPTLGGAFRNIQHAFDFGDTSSGTWVQTGNSRNSYSGGPITAHVYETPGIYTVNVTHSAAGTPNKAATPIVITVSDPDVVYAGTATICIEGGSVTGTGGPALCLYFATISAAGGIQSNKRYLFKKGQTHTGSLSTSATGVRIASYGSGAKPIITSATSISGDNVCVRDVEQRGFYQHYGVHDCVMSVDLRIPTVTTGQGMFQTQESQQFITTHNQCFWECTVSDVGGTGGYGFYGTCNSVAFLGLNTQSQFQHDVRVTNHYKTCVQNCYLQGNNPTGVQTALKMHAGSSGLTPTIWNGVSSGICASEMAVVGYNRVGTSISPINWYVNIDPQNELAGQPEGIQDGIVENNAFTRGTSGSPQDILLGGRRLTARGNTITGAAHVNIATSTPGGVEPGGSIPVGWDGQYFTSGNQ